MKKPTTRQPKHTNTGITVKNGMPAKMATKYCTGNRRNRKERTTKLANCYTGTGNDTKLLLHNVFFRSFSPAKADKKPKGNGIKDGFCAVGFVFMPESFGLFSRAYVRLPAVTIFAIYKNMGKGCVDCQLFVLFKLRLL